MSKEFGIITKFHVRGMIFKYCEYWNKLKNGRMN